MTAPCLLIADIGGTNARFALADASAPGFGSEVTLRCNDYPTAKAAIDEYLRTVHAPPPDVICIAAAGPIVGDRVRFTNNHWTLACNELAGDFSASKVRLLNDFEAIAYSIPLLRDKDCASVGLQTGVLPARDDFSVGIIGPGTGLGAAGLLRRDGRLVPVVGEAGHVGFAPETQLQVEVLAELREEFERVSDERLVSGPGLENIYTALARLHAKTVPHASARDIFSRAADNSEDLASEALQLFFEILGQVAGNLALSFAAADGIYIAGGIVKRGPALLANSRFRSGFERKGRNRAMMERIPTRIIMHPEPGLLGASFCAVEIQANRMRAAHSVTPGHQA